MLGTNTESFALLIHRHAKSEQVKVTSHKVIPSPVSGFTLGAGRLFSQQDMDTMLDVLAGTNSQIEFIPDNVLARDSSGCNMVWFTPPKVCEVHFTDATYNVPLPMLVYAKFERQPVRVFAIKGRARPTPESKLWIAPLGNINVNGTMCGGNVRHKEFNGYADREALELFAVEARATHLGDTPPASGLEQKGDRSKTFDNFKSFMAQLHEEKAKAFPSKRLLPACKGDQPQYTLADLIRAGVAQ